jgi:isopentenyl phosphate kinase
MMDIPPAERHKKARKAAATQRKLSKVDVSDLRRDRAGGMTYKMLMAKYGLAKSTVSYIVNGKTYTT